jgi:hypothetical protein
MSQLLISRNAPLKRLRDEGYDIEIRAGYLLMKQVPYVTAQREVRRGILASELTIDGSIVRPPSTHVAWFSGDHPCRKDGSRIETIAHSSAKRQIDQELGLDHQFSARPPSGYPDEYEKMTAYVRIICAPAEGVDGSSPRVYPAIPTTSEESVFCYLDTASSRAGITAASEKLGQRKIAIIGVGGTGAYVLDFVAKTPAPEIHLFEGDRFSNHNAFRSPGAASLRELQAGPKKVNYFAEAYSRMHRHIVPHDCFVDETNVGELSDMGFVFICIDKGSLKKAIIEFCETHGIPFVDVGMGIELDDNQQLGGLLRVTSSTPEKRGHVRDMKRISFADGADDDYRRNIQIAELNALNASMAVIKWKKIVGFYRDLDREHNTTYTLDGNHVLNEDQHEG